MEIRSLYREKLYFPGIAWVQKHKETWQEEEAQQQTLLCGREILSFPDGEGSSSCVACLILLESHCQTLGAFYSCLVGDVM